MKKIFVALMCIFTCFLQACSTKYAQVSYSRPDIETDVSAVIVFPTTTLKFLIFLNLNSNLNLTSFEK